jgi:hypothetical protein
MYFPELSENINKKISLVLFNMRNTNISKYNLYKTLDDVVLLNLSFRLGDDLHCQWTDDEENLILPVLVSNNIKPIGTIANRRKDYFNNIIIPSNCDSLIIKNRWNMWVLVIYLKNLFSYNELEELVNETNSFSKRGSMLGYGEATY